MRSLVERWQHRVTCLVGGPGLGKTTLLAQALAENRLAPRGEDVWIGLEPRDADADRLARLVAAAVAGERADSERAAGRDHPIPEPGSVADVVWHRSPAEACLVFDDVHVLPAGSTGASWLGDLVQALPGNGHVVLASRSEPPVALARLNAQGAVLRLVEEDLRFSDDELWGFASRRGLDPGLFAGTGGWPAMAELAASVEQRFSGVYLWEEVLEPLGTVRRHVLAVLCDLGGGDEDLVSAAVGTPVELARVIASVPLVARDADGRYVPHALWRNASGLALAPSERLEIRRRAAEHLQKRGRFDEAFNLLAGVELWDAVPVVLRDACLRIDRLDPRQLGRWLAVSPDTVRASLAGRLASAMHTAFVTPDRAVEPLTDAGEGWRAEGDVDAELAVLAQFGQLAWWHQDLDLLAVVGARIVELEPTGNALAHAMASIARAMVGDLAGDDAEVLAQLDDVDSGLLQSVWAVGAGWICGVVHLDVGQPDAALEIVERLAPTADPAMRPTVDALEFRTWWSQGRVDEALARIPPVIAAEQRTGPTYSVHIGQVYASIAFSHTGDVVAARRYLDDALATAPPSPGGKRSVQIAASTASLWAAEGDEAGAAAILGEAMEAHGVDEGIERRGWRQVLSLSYVLVPETRKHWDGAVLRGYLWTARELSRAVIALRKGRGGTVVGRLDIPEPGVIRSALHHRFAAELALGLSAAGRPEGRALLDALGAAGRSALRDLATRQPQHAKPARALLAAVPAPPPQITYLSVLGALELHRDGPSGVPVGSPDLRRARLRTLIAFLVGHRRTTRSAIMAALWPDLHEQAAGNNLGVTLNHLLRLLEPWRDSGEPSYLVRVDGQAVQLVVGPHLHVDVDQFDDHLAAAASAEADSTPSLALEHDLAAVDLYRGDLYLDVPEAEWLMLDREHYRRRFVGAAVRAGQLLVGRGETEQAQAVAHKALGADPWAEEAYGVLAGAALARGQRSAARRILERCVEMLAGIGAEPSVATQQIARRVHSSD